MPDPIACTVFVFLSFLAAGIAQTLWLRSAVSRRFSAPLDGGRTFRQRRIFGDNKTWRGFLVIVPAAGLAFLAFRLLTPSAFSDRLWNLTPFAYFLLGCWVGLGFMLGELPNSFLKRQWEIGPGEAPAGFAARTVCFTIDQVDSIIGGLLALAVVVTVPLLSWIYIVVIGALIHWGFNLLLMLLGVKARAA